MRPEHGSGTSADGGIPVSLAAETATPRQRRILLSFCAVYALAALALVPFAHHPGPVVPAATTTFGAGVLITDLCTSFLLLVQVRVAPSWSMLLLAAAYFYTGAMALLHVLSFPGAWIPDAVLIGTPQTVGWLFILWSVGFPAVVLTAIIAEALFKDRRIADDRIHRAIATVFGSVLAVIAAFVLIATLGQDRLPPELHGHRFAWWGNMAQWSAVGISLVDVMALWLVTRGRNVLYLWLGLALVAFMAFNMLAVSGGGRYTVGWHASRISGFVSASLLLLFFLGEFAKLQRSLASALRRLRGANEVLERRVAERTADLQASNTRLTRALTERDLLLREVYHRVKNNLQIIDGFLSLQAYRLTDPEAKNAIGDLRHRVHALGLVHQQLMTSDDLETFDMAPFLRELAENIIAASRNGIALNVEAESQKVNLDFAIPVGLLVTELVTNSLKHAFRDDQDGTIVVRFGRCPDGSWLLSMSDDGGQEVAGTVPMDTGLGRQIIEGLVAQLDADMEVTTQNGHRTEIRIPAQEHA